MLYRHISNTGLKVSVLSFGNWIMPKEGEKSPLTEKMVKMAFEAGVNFFDTAETYSKGLAESQLGNALNNLNYPRNQIVVTTKIYWGDSTCNTITGCGLSRKHIVEGLNASLKRLKMDYVDIVYCHRPDKDVDLEDICRSMNWVIDQGKAFYWGTSEWSACQISASIEICKKLGLSPPVVEQPQYNMLHRERFEGEYRDLYELYNMGTTVWSPLAGGLLSGRFNEGKIPKDSRVHTNNSSKYFMESKIKKDPLIYDKLKKLGELAKELGCTQSQLALLWVIMNKDVTTCILGASKESQLSENLETIKLVNIWNPEIEARIEEILGNGVDPDINWKTLTPLPGRRELSLRNNNN